MVASWSMKGSMWTKKDWADFDPTEAVSMDDITAIEKRPIPTFPGIPTRLTSGVTDGPGPPDSMVDDSQTISAAEVAISMAIGTTADDALGAANSAKYQTDSHVDSAAEVAPLARVMSNKAANGADGDTSVADSTTPVRMDEASDLDDQSQVSSNPKDSDESDKESEDSASTTDASPADAPDDAHGPKWTGCPGPL